MHFWKKTLVIGTLIAGAAIPLQAQEASGTFDPNGTFVDQWGTTFTFSLCGDGTALCGTLDVLKGDSATEENLAFVGKQVMQAAATGPNEWKGALEAGGISAEATVTQTSPDTIDIQGCRAILCQTITYTRS
ncbi:MAG TPA: hypothetical protein VIL88_10675 [Devosia sp.]|uniref:hypothetical protein n=1 Tax=Devosia sp. TaxID=1871048 RepID=UPI002F94FD3B